MKILIVAATNFEIMPTIEFCKKKTNQHEVEFLITGIGVVATTFHLLKQLQGNKYDLVINAGIAGAINKEELALGDVVNIVCEKFGDIGAEDKDGTFIDFFQNGLISQNTFPFQDGELLNLSGAEFEFLPLAKGITRNTASGYQPAIDVRNGAYLADVETMESAAFFYVCLQEKINFLAIRSISNYVESRNREHWRMDLAIHQLNETLKEIVVSGERRA